MFFSERFNCTKRDLLKKPVFERSESNWIDVLPKITKQNNIRIHSSSKLTPTQASLKKHENIVFHKILDKRPKVKPKFQVNDLVRTAYLKRIFSKCDMTHSSEKLYEITEIICDTIPTYRIDNLPERYKEALLRRTELTTKKEELWKKEKSLR